MKRIIITALMGIFFFVGAVQADLGDVDIHGFIAQGFIQSSDNNFLAKTRDGTFEFNEMGINFSTDLTENLRAGMQFFARDLGDMGNDEIILDWAFADYRYKPWLGLRVGKMKSPFGLYNETRDVDMLRTSIFLPQGVYNEGWRDSLSSLKGTGVYGAVPIGILGELSYNVQTGVMDAQEDGGVGKFAQDLGDLTANSIDAETSYVSSVIWETPLQGLKLGTTYSKIKFELLSTTNDGPIWKYRSIVAALGSKTDADTAIMAAGGDIDAVYSRGVEESAADLVGLNLNLPMAMSWFAYSAEYVWNDLTLAGEYSLNNIEYNMTTSANGTTIMPDTDLEIEGWYLSASYRFTELFEMGLYYSEFYPDADNKDGASMVALGYPKEAAWSKDWALSTRFDINENWVVKLEGHMIDGLAVIYMKDQEKTASGAYDVDDEWFMGAVKISYSF